MNENECRCRRRAAGELARTQRVAVTFPDQQRMADVAARIMAQQQPAG
jgi:hypothetical protein